ncbi:MAG: hypothetical protein V4637_09010 [Pseudomonadota bacterium]
MDARGSIPIWIKLGTPIALIIGFALGLINFLNYFNYQKTYRELNVARVMVIGRDLVQAVETGLNFGLAPKHNTQLDAAVSLAKDSSDGLDFVVLTDESGRWVAGAGSAPSNPNWGVRLAQAGKDAHWQGEDAVTYQLGLPYRNSFGVMIGAVVLGYNKAAIERATTAMRDTLVFNWLVGSALFGSLALFGVWRLTRRIESDLEHAASALLIADPSPALHLSVLGPEIEAGIPALLAQREAAHRALDSAALSPTG